MSKIVKTLAALSLKGILMHLSCFYMYQDKKRLIFASQKSNEKE